MPYLVRASGVSSLQPRGALAPRPAGKAKLIAPPNRILSSWVRAGDRYPQPLERCSAPSIDVHGSHLPGHHRLRAAAAPRRGRPVRHQDRGPHAPRPHGRDRRVEIDRREGFAVPDAPPGGDQSVGVALASPSFARPSGRHQRARPARPAYRAQPRNLWCCWPPSTLARTRCGARSRYRACVVSRLSCQHLDDNGGDNADIAGTIGEQHGVTALE